MTTDNDLVKAYRKLQSPQDLTDDQLAIFLQRQTGWRVTPAQARKVRTMTDPAGREKPSRMDTALVVKLIEWMSEHKAELLEQLPSWRDLAARLNKELDLKLSWRNVRLVTAKLSWAWTPKVPTRGNPMGNAANFKLHQRLEKLASAVAWLCQVVEISTGEKVPQEIQDVLSGRDQHGEDR